MVQKNTLSFSSLQSGVTHGISIRAHGSMKDNGVINEKNIQTYLQEKGIPSAVLVMGEQVHGKDVLSITTAQNRYLSHTDGMLTKKKNIFLGVVTADCLPVMFWDKNTQTVGIAHVGYKGLLSGILEEMIKKFQDEGSSVEDITVALGPAIGKCCYDIPEERATEIQEYIGESSVIEIKNGKTFFDLQDAASKVLQKLGIKKDTIEVMSLCTKCHADLFYSYRREGPEKFGEFISIIGMQ